jgi:hypothetical protein
MVCCTDNKINTFAEGDWVWPLSACPPSLSLRRGGQAESGQKILKILLAEAKSRY